VDVRVTILVGKKLGGNGPDLALFALETFAIDAASLNMGSDRKLAELTT
jgi:hypothetical protein